MAWRARWVCACVWGRQPRRRSSGGAVAGRRAGKHACRRHSWRAAGTDDALLCMSINSVYSYVVYACLCIAMYVYAFPWISQNAKQARLRVRDGDPPRGPGQAAGRCLAGSRRAQLREARPATTRTLPGGKVCTHLSGRPCHESREKLIFMARVCHEYANTSIFMAWPCHEVLNNSGFIA